MPSASVAEVPDEPPSKRSKGVLNCANCNEEVTAKMKFCHNCGSALSMDAIKTASSVAAASERARSTRSKSSRATKTSKASSRVSRTAERQPDHF
eukprot:9882960-Karenia_brevis.AAC.1